MNEKELLDIAARLGRVGVCIRHNICLGLCR